MQKNPLLPVAIIVILGIITGYELSGIVAASVWGIAAMVGLVAAIALWKFRLPQSIMIYIACFLTAGFLVTKELDRIDINAPAGAIAYEAIVAGSTAEHAKTYSCDIILTSEERPVKVRAYLRKDGRSAGLRTGDGIKAVSLLESSRPHDRPMTTGRTTGTDGHSSYSLYLISHGFSATTFIEGGDWQRVDADVSQLSILQRARINALRLRAHLLSQYRAWGMHGQALAVISSLTLGDRSMLAADTKDDYALSGASHILALSGLHLTIIYAILTLFMGRYRQHVLAILFTTVSIWLFVFLVGMPASLVRAAVMLTLYSFCGLLHRDRLSFNTLAFAALAMLIAGPLSLYDISFQLSFMAMLSIGLFFRPFMSVVPTTLLRFRIPKYIISTTILSLSAQVCAIPLVAYYFGRTSAYTLVTNAVVSLGATVILFGAALFFLLSPLPVLRTFVADTLSRTAETMNAIVARIASWPAADSLCFQPSLVQLLLIYIAIAAAYYLGCILHRVYGRKVKV